jgi:L-asparagine transporter-like permease
VLRTIGIPGSASVMNFVVLTAAITAANSSIYLVSRTLFSLARAGMIPKTLGAVNKRGVPVNALAIAGIGLLLAVVIQTRLQSSAYIWFIGVALFGALFCWLMIFVTHVAFRRAWARPGSPPLAYRSRFGEKGSLLGAVVMLAILVSTWWAPGLRVTLQASLPWLGLVGLAYWLSPRFR